MSLDDCIDGCLRSGSTMQRFSTSPDTYDISGHVGKNTGGNVTISRGGADCLCYPSNPHNNRPGTYNPSHHRESLPADNE